MTMFPRIEATGEAYFNYRVTISNNHASEMYNICKQCW